MRTIAAGFTITIALLAQNRAPLPISGIDESILRNNQSITGIIKPLNLDMLGMPKGARKINGRWWTPDNREITKSMGVWSAQQKLPNLIFVHHRPFNRTLADNLRLHIDPIAARTVTGEPNQIFIMGRDGKSGKWYYYSADGTSTSLWFVDNLLADVEFLGGPGQKGRTIHDRRRPPAIEQALAGRSPVHAALSAARRSPTTADARTTRSYSRNRAAVSTVQVEPYVPPQPKTLRTIPPDLLGGVEMGATREEVIVKLGEPGSSFSIAGGEGGTVETLTYHLESGSKAQIRITDGKVTQISR